MTQTEGNPEQADVIFAGGGTAACVAAARLAEAAPHLRIVVIEGGKTNLDDPTVTHPALFMAHLMPDSSTALFYRSEPSQDVGGRHVVVPAGGMLGGGSSINLSMYTRAQAADYDAWNTPGWTAADMIPLCNKTETYVPWRSGSGPSKHGMSGPVQISDGGFRSKSERDILDTVTKLGMKEVDDINDFETIGAFSRIPRYVSPQGKRQDAAHCYIHPLLEETSGRKHNLQLLLGSRVTRVIFDESQTPPRAIGVQYCRDSRQDGSLGTLLATRLVVVSAGALGSPQILERSGVGGKQVLESVGIPLVSDLPGVGENYQDHHLVTSSYKTSLPPEETLDSFASRRKDIAAAIAGKDPQLGWNTIDVAGKLRPDDAEAEQLGPAFYEAWQRDWKPNPGKPMIIMNFINTYVGNPGDVPADQQHVTIGSISLHPYSRGSIHVTDTDQGYKFDTGFLRREIDVKKQVWGYKRARMIARNLPFFAGEVAAAHPQYPDGSDAAVISTRAAGEYQAEIVYSGEDDAALETWIRKTVGSTWHSLGTCAMRPREEGGVVDPRLNVYGTQALKVADLSIAPGNIGANVGNTAFAIGEKAAAIILEDLMGTQVNKMA
ncbi:hypothetical protein PG988_014238 [Apiospora saccharicola]